MGHPAELTENGAMLIIVGTGINQRSGRGQEAPVGGLKKPREWTLFKGPVREITLGATIGGQNGSFGFDRRRSQTIPPAFPYHPAGIPHS